MQKMKIIVAGAMLSLLVPFAASALSPEVEAQIAALQAQLQQILAQIAAIQAQHAPNPPSCVDLVYNMGPDDTDAETNGEVSKLQRFLAAQPGIYPEGQVTGYFGPATTRAVQRWQAAHGIVSSGTPETTGYGYVGPRTRAAMSCGGISAVNFEAEPVSGTPPLTVVFTARIQANWGPSDVYFGDGSSDRMSRQACYQSGMCDVSVTHTYANVGTYTAQMIRANTGQTVGTKMISVLTAVNAPIVSLTINGQSSVTLAPNVPLTVAWSSSNATSCSGTIQHGTGTPQVWGGIVPNTSTTSPGSMGTTSVTYQLTCTGSTGVSVTREAAAYPQSTQTFTASPQSGTAPQSVLFVANGGPGGGTRTVEFGDGSSSDLHETGCPDPSSSGTGVPGPCFQGSHTYASAGTYTAKLFITLPCPASYPECDVLMHAQVGTLTIVVAATSVSPPVITTVDTQDPIQGQTVHITGTGFTDVNDIRLDGTTVQLAGSTENGTKLAFLIPEDYPAGSTNHQLTVKNQNGVSNVMDMRVRPAPVSVTLTANDQTNLVLPAGGNYTLKWSSKRATACTQTYADSSGIHTDSRVPNVSASAGTGLIGYYTFRCTDAQGRAAQKSVTISATPPADSGSVPTVAINANGTNDLSIPGGTSYTVNLNSAGATSCTLTYADSSGVHSDQRTPNQFTNPSSGLIGYYTFSCADGAGHTAWKSVTIRAIPPPDITL